MRKLIIACCLLAVSMTTFAGSRIPLYSIKDPIKKGNGPQRMPQRPLVVELDNYLLSFGYGFDETVTVELLDEDENVVYTDWLAPGQTSLVFPDTLSGGYTIQILWGNRAFEGIVEL